MIRYNLKNALFRLEVKIGLTRAELRGLLLIAGLLVAGIMIREWSLTIPAVDPALYEELEAEFAARMARFPPLPLVGPPHEDLPAPDSSLVRVIPAEATALINLNRATAEDLIQLPGIGPALASRILAHRQNYGAFNSVEDLQMIRGIGPATLKRIRLLVRVGQAPRDDPAAGPPRAIPPP